MNTGGWCLRPTYYLQEFGCGVCYHLYLDYFTVFAPARNEIYSSRVIQSSFSKLVRWTRPKDMKLSGNRTRIIKIEKQKKGYELPVDVAQQKIQV